MRKLNAMLNTLVSMLPPLIHHRIARLGLILMMGFGMEACSSDQHWKEEVQLSDGRIIVVERDLITESGGDEWALNRSGSKPKEYRIRFEYPMGSGKTVEWHSTKTSPQTWPEMPLVVDVDGGQPILYSSVFILGGCQVYSKYLWTDREWTEENLPQQFVTRATNLLIFESRNMKPFFDLEAKRKNNSDVTLRIFSQVGPRHPYCR